MSYRKIGPKHPAFARVQAGQQIGMRMCDAVAHNSNYGCPNPKCFNYVPRKTKKAKR